MGCQRQQLVVVKPSSAAMTIAMAGMPMAIMTRHLPAGACIRTHVGGRRMEPKTASIPACTRIHLTMAATAQSIWKPVCELGRWLKG